MMRAMIMMIRVMVTMMEDDDDDEDGGSANGRSFRIYKEKVFELEKHSSVPRL